MDDDFTFFSTVFHANQDDGWKIIKGCVQWYPRSPRAVLKSGTRFTVRVFCDRLSSVCFFPPLVLMVKCGILLY